MAISEDDLKEQNRLIEKQVELQAKLSRLRGEDVSKTRQTMDALREQSAMAQELYEIASLEFENDAKRVEFYQQQGKFLDKQLQAGKISYEQQQNIQNLLIDIYMAQEAGDKAALDAAKKKLDLEQKRTNALLQSSKAGATLANNLARVMGFDDQAVKLGKSFGAVFKSTQNFGQFAKVFGQEIGELFSPAGVFGQLVANTFLLAGGLAKQEAAFVAATGITQDFSDEVIALKEEFADLTGVLDIYPILTQLNQGFIGFKDLNRATRLEMSRATLTLERFGISAAQSADILNELVKRARILPEDATDALMTIVSLAEETSFPLGELASAFQASQKELSIFGPQGVKMFGQLARSAESMGLRVGEGTQMLLKMTQGFDTFESAASKVATINAFLGGSFVDTFSMVMATAEGPGAQLNLLEAALNNAGINADNFGDNIFRAKGLADGFGVSVDNLRAFLSGEIDETEVFLTTQDKMMKLLDQAVDPMTKLSNAVQDLTFFVNENKENFKILLDGVVSVVDFFANTATGKFMGFAYMLSGILGPLLVATKGGFGGISLAIAGIAGVLYVFDKLINYLAESEEGAVKLGAAIGGIGGAIFGGMKGFVLSGGNPLGALAGAVIGGTIGAAGAGALGGAVYEEKPTGGPLTTDSLRSMGAAPTIMPMSKPPQTTSVSRAATQNAVMVSGAGAGATSVAFSEKDSKLLSDFVQASKSLSSRPVQVNATMKMENGRTFATAMTDVVNAENDRRHDISRYG